jgi:hypothetical protein
VVGGVRSAYGLLTRPNFGRVGCLLCCSPPSPSMHTPPRSAAFAPLSLLPHPKLPAAFSRPRAPAVPPAAARARRITCGVRAPVPPHAAGALRPCMTPQGAGPAAAAPADPGRNRRLGGAARRRPALLLPRAFVTRNFAAPRRTPCGRLSPCFPWPATPARRAPHPCRTRRGCLAGRPPPRRPAGTFFARRRL